MTRALCISAYTALVRAAWVPPCSVRWVLGLDGVVSLYILNAPVHGTSSGTAGRADYRLSASSRVRCSHCGTRESRPSTGAREISRAAGAYGLPVICPCNYKGVITAVITCNYSPWISVTCNPESEPLSRPAKPPAPHSVNCEFISLPVCVCVCHAPNLGAVPSQQASSHLKGGFPRHRTAALFREAWDVTRPRRVEKHVHRGQCPRD